MGTRQRKTLQLSFIWGLWQDGTSRKQNGIKHCCVTVAGSPLHSHLNPAQSVLAHLAGLQPSEAQLKSPGALARSPHVPAKGQGACVPSGQLLFLLGDLMVFYCGLRNSAFDALELSVII